jgi:hypothetical protein
MARALAPLLLALVVLASCTAKRPEPAAKPAPAAEARPPSPPACAGIERIALRKSERTLVATCIGGESLVLPVALAREAGPKRASGDQRVPEGDYHVAGPARPSRFLRFVPIDYPSPADAERALGERRITRAQYEAVVAAHAARRLPPQDTPLGGHLGLHGEGRRWQGELALDWTEGCIALSDEGIELLERLAPPGTPVHIEP